MQIMLMESRRAREYLPDGNKKSWLNVHYRNKLYAMGLHLASRQFQHSVSLLSSLT